MKRLEDIPKKDIFNIPESYFEKLPEVVQARVAKKEKNPIFSTRLILRYAIPVVVLAVVSVMRFTKSAHTQTPETILATIETNDLVAYLEDANLTTDELLDEINLSNDEILELENEAYSLPFNESLIEDMIFESLDADNL